MQRERIPKFLKYCKCPCGQEILWKPHYKSYGIPDYIKGHSSKGKKMPVFSKALKDFYQTQEGLENKRRKSEKYKGKRFAEPKRSRKEYLQTERGKQSIEKYKQHHPSKNPEYRRKHREGVVKSFVDGSHAEKISIKKKKFYEENPEFKKLIGYQSKKRWLDPVYKENSLRKMFNSCKRKPNNTETYMDSLVQRARPTDFIYSGAGKIFIAGKVPDWFNVNGRKQVIELFGNYWHGEKRTGRTKEQEEELLKSHYSKYGYDCLVIWESELKNPIGVIDKVKNF